MARESAQAGITCPKCDGLSAPNQNFCGYCGAALNDSNRRRDYECAVGSAILALNSLESEVFHLLDILDVHCVVKERTKKGNPLPLEGAFFSEKIDMLHFCHGPRLVNPLSHDPVAGVLLLSGVGAWPPPDGVG